MIHLDYVGQAIFWAVGGVAGGLIIRVITRTPKRSKERR